MKTPFFASIALALSGCIIALGTNAPIETCAATASGPVATFDFGHNPSPEEMGTLSALGLLGDNPSDGYIDLPGISFRGTQASVSCPPGVSYVQFVK